MITCVSDHVRSQVESVLAVAGSKVITVANGVTMLELRHEGRHRDGSRYVLYVGGHEPRKNIEALFSSMAIYWQRYEPTLELRLTGFRETLSREASLSFDRLEGPVRFLGQIDEVELSRQYAGAMAMLMLSKDEGFGLPVLEAMAHGCPVIAARAASLPEVVGDAGLLVDSANSGEVARALNRIVQDEAVRLQLIERGLGRAALFSWRHTADRMRDVYVRTVDVPGWRAARSTPEGESISKPPAWSPQIAIRA